MLTADEKTCVVMDLAPIEELSEDEYKKLFFLIRRAIKEQDRDTRHACAEASLQCGTVTGAHDACMNVKAV